MDNQLKGWVTPAIVGVVSFAGGAITGYFIRKRQENSLKEEIADTRIGVIADMEALESNFAQLCFAFEERDRKYDGHLQKVMRVVSKVVDDVTVSEYVDVVHGAQINTEVTLPTESDEEEWSEEADDDWDYDVEVPLRGPVDPYIIHRDEFFADEEGYDNHTTLTYYQGDDILCDETDAPIYNADKITGPLIFGHGSQDPSIVYIRNPRLKAEYEVLLEYGTFAEEILGQKVHKSLEAEEFKHSLLKFREE